MNDKDFEDFKQNLKESDPFYNTYNQFVEKKQTNFFNISLELITIPLVSK